MNLQAQTELELSEGNNTGRDQNAEREIKMMNLKNRYIQQKDLSNALVVGVDISVHKDNYCHRPRKKSMEIVDGNPFWAKKYEPENFSIHKTMKKNSEIYSRIVLFFVFCLKILIEDNRF